MDSTPAPYARSYAPPGAFLQGLRVRSYEVGHDGTIGAGTILRYLEGIATEASAALGFDFRWYEAHNSAWVVRTMELVLEASAGIGDALGVATWVADFKRVQAQREYAVWREDDGRLVARASARWGYIDRTRLRPTALPDELAGHFPTFGQAMAPLAFASEPHTASADQHAQGEWSLVARGYEMDSQQHINNTIYADWLAEGLRRLLANEHAGARASQDAPQPHAYHIEYVQPSMPGEELHVATTVWGREDGMLSVTQGIVGQRDGSARVRSRSEHRWTRSGA